MNIVRTLTSRPSLISNCVDHFRAAATSTRFFHSTLQRNNASDEPKLQEIEPKFDSDKNKLDGVISNINTELAGNTQGRLFAQIHVCGKQFKVTPEDLITLEGQWAPDAGERIKLEKVLLVGGENFTLIGQPVLPPGLVSVEATVVEKTITHTKFVFKKKRRENYIRTHLHRPQLTVLRINSIKINHQLSSSSANE